MWEGIATSESEVMIGHITPENSWAVDVGMDARLELHQEGYLAVRNMRPPKPYLAHGALM
jgi:hypothetical protein